MEFNEILCVLMFVSFIGTDESSRESVVEIARGYVIDPDLLSVRSIIESTQARSGAR